MSKRLNRSRDNFSLEIDLLSAFGAPVPESVALSFGQAIIDRILERTESNRGSDGRRFKNYSESYSETLEFLAAGKSRTDPNLELTGDMLFNIDIIEATPARLVIGFPSKLQRDKAYNHHTGDTLPARPFFDIPDNEYSALISEFEPEVQQVTEQEETGSFSSTVSASLLQLLGELNGED